MQFAIHIVFRNDDRGGGTAESSQGLEGKRGQRERQKEKEHETLPRKVTLQWNAFVIS